MLKNEHDSGQASYKIPILESMNGCCKHWTWSCCRKEMLSGGGSDPEVLEDDGDGVPVAAWRRGGRGMEILQLRAAETYGVSSLEQYVSER